MRLQPILMLCVAVTWLGVHDWYRYSLGRRDGRAYYPLDLPADALPTALAASPTNSVSTWRSPVLFIHGDDDHNVEFFETVRLAESLRAHGVVYSDLSLFRRSSRLSAPRVVAEGLSCRRRFPRS